jgi:hypothetical protein
MGIGKAHSFIYHTIKVRSGDFVVWIVRLNITYAEIISQNDDNIR